MKKHITLALFIAVLVGIIITGCSPSVGSTITFGNYNGKPIKWYILDNDEVNHRYLLLAKDVLEERPYHTTKVAITWEQSTIRSWLNNDFFESAFTSEEKAKIPKVTVINDDNPDFHTPGGNNTQDYVFLLSINEVKTLVPSYVDSHNEVYIKLRTKAPWWLRSPGEEEWEAVFVGDNGLFFLVGNDGHLVNLSFSVDAHHPLVKEAARNGVRPALWMNY